MNKAVILLSGGIDSSTALAVAKSEGYGLYALSLDYGQRHVVEIERAKEISHLLGAVEHKILKIDLRQIGGSALTSDLQVPKGRSPGEMESGIPATYVPARNTIFLSLALAWAEVLGAQAIFIGVNVLDYSGYPDCRPAFLGAFERMAQLATKAGVEQSVKLKVKAPLIQMSKAEIIQLGQKLGVPFHLTHSCYDPMQEGRACGCCDSCLLRKKGFEELGAPDPTLYAV